MAATTPAGGGIRRNITALAGAQAVTWSMALLWTLVVPRALGPGGLGTMMAAWAATAIFGLVLGLGTRNYLVRESVVDRDGAPLLLGTAVVLRIALAPLLFAAAVLYGELLGWDGEARTVLLLAAAATVFVQIAEPLQAGFQAVERMEYLALSEVIGKSAQGLVGIGVVLLGFGAIGVTASWAAMAALVVALDAYWLRGLLRVDLRTSVRRLVRLVRESAPYWAFGVFFMVYLWIDFVLLSLLTRAEVVGWYSVPMKLFQTLMFLPVVVSTAWLPRLVQGFDAGEAELRRAARQPTELVLLLSLPICAGTDARGRPGDRPALRGGLRGVRAGADGARALPAADVPEHHAQPGARRAEAPGLVDVGDGGRHGRQPAAQLGADQGGRGALRQRRGRGGHGALPHGARRRRGGRRGSSAGASSTGARRCGRWPPLTAAAGAFAIGYAARPLGAIPSLAAGAGAFCLLAAALRVFTSEEIALLTSAARRVASRLPFVGRRAAATAVAAGGGRPPA